MVGCCGVGPNPVQGYQKRARFRAVLDEQKYRRFKESQNSQPASASDARSDSTPRNANTETLPIDFRCAAKSIGKQIGGTRYMDDDLSLIHI